MVLQADNILPIATSKELPILYSKRSHRQIPGLRNHGPGADRSGQVNWARALTKKEAREFSPERIFRKAGWNILNAALVY